MRFVTILGLVPLFCVLLVAPAAAECGPRGCRPRLTVEAAPGTRVVIRGGLFSFFRPRVVVEYPAK